MKDLLEAFQFRPDGAVLATLSRASQHSLTLRFYGDKPGLSNLGFVIDDDGTEARLTFSNNGRKMHLSLLRRRTTANEARTLRSYIFDVDRMLRAKAGSWPRALFVQSRTMVRESRRPS